MSRVSQIEGKPIVKQILTSKERKNPKRRTIRVAISN